MRSGVEWAPAVRAQSRSARGVPPAVLVNASSGRAPIRTRGAPSRWTDSKEDAAAICGSADPPAFAAGLREHRCQHQRTAGGDPLVKRRIIGAIDVQVPASAVVRGHPRRVPIQFEEPVDRVSSGLIAVCGAHFEQQAKDGGQLRDLIGGHDGIRLIVIAQHLLDRPRGRCAARRRSRGVDERNSPFEDEGRPEVRVSGRSRHSGHDTVTLHGCGSLHARRERRTPALSPRSVRGSRRYGDASSAPPACWRA
jgi:hypothetical protein